MWKSRNKKDGFPAEPPSPEELAARRKAEDEAQEREFREFVSRQVAPRINAALRSSRVVHWQVGYYSVGGSSDSVSVSAGDNGVGWAIEMSDLLTLMYRQYRVVVRGQWTAGGGRGRLETREEEIRPATITKLIAFQNKHHGAVVSVYIVGA